MTLRLFRENKPIISYGATSYPEAESFLSINNVIFRDNNTQTKALIAPKGTRVPKEVYLFNNLFYNNAALSAAEIASSKKAHVLNNTIVDNAFGSALTVSGKKNTWIVACPRRSSGSSTERSIAAPICFCRPCFPSSTVRISTFGRRKPSARNRFS